MRIKILAIGKLKQEYKLLQEDFLKRIKFVSVIEIKERNKNADTKNIIRKLENLEGFKILCSVDGKIVDDFYFDNILEKSKIIFIIGGPDGLTKEIENYVDEKISFSKLTFNHQLFRIMLLEQIYRAYCRKIRHPYAKH